MWSGYHNHVTVVKILLASPGIDVNMKDEVSDFVLFLLDWTIN